MTKQPDWDSVPVIEAGIGEIFKFEDKGDVLIGEYLGTGTLDTDDGEATYLRFQQEDGTVKAVSVGFDLNRKILEGGDEGNPIEPGAMVRIEYVSDTETARGQTPMKVYKVQATF